VPFAFGARVYRLSRFHRHFQSVIEDRLEDLFPSGLRLVADPRGSTSIADALAGSGKRVLLAIGPEGGWSDVELGLLVAHTFIPVSLGPRTLRVDTACTALLAIAHSALATTSSARAPVVDRNV
jgi:RsmE family RNA methyltransferase